MRGRNRLAAALLLGCLTLTACGKPPAEVPPVPVQPEVQTEPVRPLPEKPKETAFDRFSGSYMEGFPAVAYTGARTLFQGNRDLVLEDVPENTAEELVAQYYIHQLRGDLEAQLPLMGEESLQITAESDAGLVQRNIGFRSVILHDITMLKLEDYFPGAGYFETEELVQRFAEEQLRQIGESGLSQYTVVYVDLSWEWTPEAMALGPQLGDGRYERLFLLGRAGEGADWKIYNIGWGEYDLDRTLEPRNDPQAVKLAKLALREADYPTNPVLTVLLRQTIGERTLLLVEVEGGPHIAGLKNLVLGVYDEQTDEFVGDTFAIHGDEPGYTSWWGEDSGLYLLWTNTIYYQGYGTSNGLGYFRFGSDGLEPIYALPTCALDSGVLTDPAQAEGMLRDGADGEFWSTRKARPVVGGIDLYEAEPNWMPGQGEQWSYVGFVPFSLTLSPVPEDAKELIRDYLEETWPGHRTYFLGEAPGEPQEDDVRIDRILYAGEEVTYETVGVAFQVKRSYYNTWHSEDPGPTWREGQSDIYVILGRDVTGDYYEVRGLHEMTPNESVNRMILEVSHDLMDLEVSLWREGYPWPAGPGSQIPFFREAYDGTPTVEVLEGWEPIYWPGAYWSRQSWDGFSALCYHVGEEPGHDDPDAYSVYTIDTTRTDLTTYRGIRVGDRREAVLEAYPELYDTPYWHDNAPDFPGQDYLWYCDNSEGWGAALLFFFEGDTVSQIRLNNMFN